LANEKAFTILEVLLYGERSMNKRAKKIITWLIVVLAIAGGLWGIIAYQRAPGQYDAFASCLKEKGAVFYGAFWCPHCQKQKAMFGRSARLLPYVECSTPDGRGQLAVCKDKKIEGYPTWEFADGSRESGEVPLSRLSEKTGCPLVQPAQ
jgi:thiol-disulfide isomerase/thioredoxin